MPDIKITHMNNVLLLQGPMGPFFRHFARVLSGNGKTVHKINFNAGDDLFFSGTNVHRYTDTPGKWAAWLNNFITEQNIDTIFVFGDCRRQHVVAHKIAADREIAFHAFEEGYVRPDYITLEHGGVNGKSSMPTDPVCYPLRTDWQEDLRPVRHNHLARMTSAVCYYAANYLFKHRYPHYRHHKDPSPWRELACWTRSYLRLPFYKWFDSRTVHRLKCSYRDRYYLVPLQVFNDSQVIFHSHYLAVEEFITQIISSFANNAPSGTLLVIKHHPMDRGHKHYGWLIEAEARRHNITGRVLYLHESHLPTLLKNALGTVVINSTVGLSSLHHGTPVKVMGQSVYDIKGLVSDKPLDSFWNNPGEVDEDLYRGFRSRLIDETQLRGCFHGTWPYELSDPKTPLPGTPGPGVTANSTEYFPIQEHRS